jgi:hypothetical protein
MPRDRGPGRVRNDPLDPQPDRMVLRVEVLGALYRTQQHRTSMCREAQLRRSARRHPDPAVLVLQPIGTSTHVRGNRGQCRIGADGRQRPRVNERPLLTQPAGEEIHAPVGCATQQHAQVGESDVKPIQQLGYRPFLMRLEPIRAGTGQVREMVPEPADVRARTGQRLHQHRDVTGPVHRQRLHPGHRFDRHRRTLPPSHHVLIRSIVTRPDNRACGATSSPRPCVRHHAPAVAGSVVEGADKQDPTGRCRWCGRVLGVVGNDEGVRVDPGRYR